MVQTITRLISGKGIIIIPEEYREARDIFLYVDLVRNATSEYRNLQWSPSQTFHAHVCFCIDEHVLQTYDVKHDAQVFQVFRGQASQNLLSLICATNDLLNSFVQYAVASGLIFTKNHSIKEHPYETFLPNNIRFYCYADCALQLVLKGTDFEKCDPTDGDDSPPPPPPPPPEKVPSGVPIEVSPPYDNDEGEDTIPAPIDRDPVPPPVGEECEVYNLVFSYTATSDGNSNRVENQLINVWGEYGAISSGRLPNNDPAIFLECRGLADFEACGEFRVVPITSLVNAGLSVEFSDATLD